MREKQSDRLTDLQKIEIVEKYKTGQYNCAELGREYGIRGDSISGILRRRDIVINNNRSKLSRKYQFNENFFDKIDNESKAYFLGFLFADGYNHISRGSVNITLQEQDKEILEKLNKELELERPLLFIKTSKNSFVCKKNKTKKPFKNASDSYRLTINNKHMSQHLAKLGCVQAKSLILKFPTEDVIPPHLIRHFIRGYFDGDGSFSGSKNKNGYGVSYTLSLVSTPNMCEKISDFFKILTDGNIIIRKRTKYKEQTRELTFGGKRIFKILDWLYEDSIIYLKRKYDKYVEMKSNADLRVIPMKAYKFCTFCNEANYARSYNCKKCNQRFISKKERFLNENILYR